MANSLDRNEYERPIEEPGVVDVRVVLGFLERVAAQVEQKRHAQLGEWLPPDAECLSSIFREDDLPVARYRAATIRPSSLTYQNSLRGDSFVLPLR